MPAICLICGALGTACGALCTACCAVGAALFIAP